MFEVVTFDRTGLRESDIYRTAPPKRFKIEQQRQKAEQANAAAANEWRKLTEMKRT